MTSLISMPKGVDWARRLDDHHARVDDHDVRRPERLLCCVEQALDGRYIAELGLQGYRSPTAPGDAVSDRHDPSHGTVL
ncbi:hypothetical protein [Roseateles sp. P5_D6]